MSNFESNSQSGKSLIEVVIILVIIGVLATFAIVRTGQSDSLIERQNIARKLKVLLERARFDAVKRRAETVSQMSYVVINNATSFSVALDFNQNGSLDGTEIQQVNFSGADNVKITGNNLVFPITLRFDRRGRVYVADGNGSAITPNFIVCNDCTLETANNANANIISISATGTVNMIGGGDVLPPFNTPTVSTVDAGSNINDWVTVSGGSSASPTATPTPVPTGTPINSPTPTPTPTATPTPQSTPAQTTPTPQACVRGERPAQTGCACQLPLTLRSNGKCQ